MDKVQGLENSECIRRYPTAWFPGQSVDPSRQCFCRLKLKSFRQIATTSGPGHKDLHNSAVAEQSLLWTCIGWSRLVAYKRCTLASLATLRH